MFKNKLIKTGLCALSLLSVFSPMVYAEDGQSDTEQIMPVGTTQDLKTVTLSYEVSESYEWNIHPAIDFGKNAGVNQTVSVKNNTVSVTKNVLRSGSKLVIKIKGGDNNNAFTISNGKSQTLDYVVNDGSKDLNINDTVMEVPAGTNTANKSIEFTLKTAKKNAEIAGSYNSTVSYTAEIEQPSLPIDGNYFGYYADVDGNGTVDGVIFNDSLVPLSGTWGSDTNAGNASHNGYGDPNKIKKYIISQDSFTGQFGTKPVISPTSEGEDRFYVMALKDITGSTYTWYNAAYNQMNDYASTTSGDFGAGKTNTATMINKWNNKAYGEQNTDPDYKDMWSKITNNGWFVPSRAEWATFATTLGINGDNYSGFGLSDWYWSSSQGSSTSAWSIYFGVGYVRLDDVVKTCPVRLATTF